MEISLRDGRRMRLDQVANVSDTIAERRSAALHNGKQVVGFEIMRSPGAGDVEVGDGVSRAAREASRKRTRKSREREVFNIVDMVYETYKGSMEMMFEGALLAVIVVDLLPAQYARHDRCCDRAAAGRHPDVCASCICSGSRSMS